MRAIIDSEGPQTDLESKKLPPCKEMDAFAAVEANEFSRGAGEILRLSQGAVNLFCEALREGGQAGPAYIPFSPPKLPDAPGSPQDAGSKRAQDGEKLRQRRNYVKTSCQIAGQLALSYLRYIVAGEVAGTWVNFGGFGAILTNLAHVAYPSVFRSVETASRADQSQGSAWSQLARGRGNLQLVKGDLVRLNRGRLLQRVSAQLAEYVGRKKGGASYGHYQGYAAPSSSSRNKPHKRSASKRPQGGPETSELPTRSIAEGQQVRNPRPPPFREGRKGVGGER